MGFLMMETVSKSGGKSRNLVFVLGAMVIVFVIATAFLFVDAQNLRGLNADLRNEASDLEHQLGALNMTHLDYVATHSYNDSEYYSCMAELEDLDVAHQSYVADHEYTNAEYESYVSTHQYTDSEYDSYVASHQYSNTEYQDYVDSHQYSNTEYQDYVDSHLHSNTEYWDYVLSHLYSNTEYEQARFDFYYMLPEYQKFGVYDLDDELFGLLWSEPYEAGVFDCGEMSACLEWYLENRGWNVVIAVGDAPFGGSYHAWLLVETSVGAYMPVEATSLEILWWADPYFDNYFVYDFIFEDIHEAMDFYETEVDWWTVGFCPLET